MENEEKTTVREHQEHEQHHKHHGHGEHGHKPHPRKVTVTVDTKPKEVEAGTYIVAAFKELVGVEASRVLDEVVHGEFKQLNDDQQITIKGCEVFVSHVRHGGSS